MMGGRRVAGQEERDTQVIQDEGASEVGFIPHFIYARHVPDLITTYSMRCHSYDIYVSIYAYRHVHGLYKVLEGTTVLAQHSKTSLAGKNILGWTFWTLCFKPIDNSC